MPILSISGRPGLFSLVSRGAGRLIVEDITTKKRQPVFATDRVTSLGDVAMYTDGDDVALQRVLIAMRDKENAAPCALDYKKAAFSELQQYFATVLPNFDRDRVAASHIKKLIQWYNTLIAAGITNFEEQLKPSN